MIPAMTDRPNTTQHRPNGDPTPDPTGTVAVSVAEAAEHLGISSEAVRMRLKRRTLPGDRDEAGHWRVWLPVGQHRPNTDPTPTQRETEHPTQRDPTGDPTPPDALVAHLRDEVAFLRGQLTETQAALALRSEELAAERQRFDVLHREALALIPALGAGHDPPSAAPAASGGAETPGSRSSSTSGSWWRRWWRR
jgi:hypothetical protein